MSTLNAAEGQRLKTEGMQRAFNFSGPWQDVVLNELRAWLVVERARGMTTMTIERFRAEAKTQPVSHKAFGSLPRIAIKAGLLTRALNADGEPIYTKAASPATRRHPVAVYRIPAVACGAS